MGVKNFETGNEIAENLEKLNCLIEEKITGLEKQLENGSATFQLFNDGLKSYKDRILKEAKGTSELSLILSGIRQKVWNDSELSYSHRRLMECLLNKFDFVTGKFQEVQFSKLVKECKIGKQTARICLELLERKGLIGIRSDGYRKYFWVIMDKNPI